jgi:hypothetical protein
MFEGLLMIGGLLLVIVTIAGFFVYFATFIAVMYMLFSGELVWQWLLWACFGLASLRFVLNWSYYGRLNREKRRTVRPRVLADALVVACFGLLLYVQPTQTPLRVMLIIFIVGWGLLRFNR